MREQILDTQGRQWRKNGEEREKDLELSLGPRYVVLLRTKGYCNKSWEDELAIRRRWHIRGVNGVFMKEKEVSTKKERRKKKVPQSREEPLHRRMSRTEKRKRRRMRNQYTNKDSRCWSTPFPTLDDWEESSSVKVEYEACVGHDVPDYGGWQYDDETLIYESDDSVQTWSSAEASSYVDSQGETVISGPDSWYDSGGVLSPQLQSNESIDIEDYDSEEDVILWNNGARTYGSVVVEERGGYLVSAHSHADQLQDVTQELNVARRLHRLSFRHVMEEFSFMVESIAEKYDRHIHKISLAGVFEELKFEATYRNMRREARERASTVDAEACIGLEDVTNFLTMLVDPMKAIEKKTVVLVEQLSLLAYSCHNCKDMTGIAAVVSLWLLTRYGDGKSLFIDGYSAMTKILSDNNYEDMMKNVPSFFESSSGCEMSYGDMSQKLYEASVGSEHSAYVPREGAFTGGETLGRVMHLLSTLGSMGMCSLFGYAFDFGVCTSGYQDMFNFVSKVSLVESISEHIKYFIRIGWMAYDKKDPWVLLGGNERSDFVQRIVDVETSFKELASGWREMDNITKTKLTQEIAELGTLSRKFLKRASGPALRSYEIYAERVAGFDIELKRLSAVGTARREPLTFLCYAHSGQGKTNFINAMTTGMLNAYVPESANESSIQVSVGVDKYDNMTVGKPILVHEELGSINPDKTMDPGAVIGQIQRTINPTGVVGVYADLHDKGSLLQAYKIVVGTTNVKDLWMTTLAGDPGAVMRRWNYVISIEAKTGYTQGGVLKNWLVPEDHDPWFVTIETVEIVYKRSAVVSTPSYTHEGAKFSFKVVEETDELGESIRYEKVDFNTAFKFMARKYREHADNQRDWTRAEAVNVRLGVCPHRVLYKYCRDEQCAAVRAEKKAEFADKCEELVQPKIPWRTTLRNYLASNGEEGVEESKCEDSDIDFKKRVFRQLLNGPVTALEFIRYNKIMDRHVPYTVATALMRLMKWHKDHPMGQHDEFFKSEKKDELRGYFLLLLDTRYVWVRAPWINCKYDPSNFVIVEKQRDYQLGKADQSADYRSWFPTSDSFERQRLAREFDKEEKEHPIRVRLFTKVCDVLGANNMGRIIGISDQYKCLRARRNIFYSACSMLGCVAYFMFKMSPTYLALIYLFLSSGVIGGIDWWMGLLVTYGAYLPCMTGELRVALLYLKAREMCKQKYAKILVGVTVLLASSKIMYDFMKKKEDIDKGFQSCGSTFARPVELRPDYVDYYQKPLSDFKKYTSAKPTNTVDQALLKLDKHLLAIRFSRPNCSIDSGFVSFQNCIHSGSCIITNAHPFNGLGEDDFMEIEVYRDKSMGPYKRQKIIHRNIMFFGNDLAAVYVSVQPAANLFVAGDGCLFPEVYPPVNINAMWMYRNHKTMEIEKERVKVKDCVVEYKESRHGVNYKYPGYAFQIKEAKTGQCMALLVGHVSPVTVLGVHVAGRIGSQDAFATVLLRPEAEMAIAELQKRYALPLACIGDDIDVDPYDKGYALDDITKDTMINFVPEGMRVSSVIHGQIPGLVPRSVRMGDASFTSIGKKMEKLHPEYSVSVPRNLHRNGFILPYRQASTSETSINPFVAAKAMDEMKAFVRERIAMAEKVGGVSLVDAIHPIPMESVFNDKVSGFNTPDLSKSAGHGLPGKKSLYVDVEEDGFKVLDPLIVARVNLLFERAKKKIMSQTIHSASLKKELLPTAKCRPPGEPRVVYERPAGEGEIYIEDLLEYKVRMFAGCSFEYLIACKMMFGMLLRFFTLHSTIFGMAFGINPHSYDFTEMTKRWLKHVKNVLAGDYKKFDKKLDSTVTCAGVEIILYILELAGYNEEQLTICGMLLLEVIFPTYVWAGVVVTLAQSSPSGHPLTAFKNNFDNRFCLSYTWYEIYGIGKDAPSFNQNVELNMMGDDHIGTVDSNYPEFNCLTIASIMKKSIGIEYTTADKRTMDVLYEDFETVEYLKMRAKWDPVLEVYKPLLNKASIYKMVTKTLAEHTPGSVAMDDHTYQVCHDALIHMYYYGQEEYEAFVSELEECFVGVKYRSLDAPSYNMQNEAYKRRLSASNSVKYCTDFVQPLSWVEEPIMGTGEEDWYIHGNHISVRSKYELTV